MQTFNTVEWFKTSLIPATGAQAKEFYSEFETDHKGKLLFQRY